MRKCGFFVLVGCLLPLAPVPAAEHPLSAPNVTSLTDPRVRFETPPEHWVTIERGPVRAVIADNAAIDVPDVPGHRAGYNGVAVLSHTLRKDNLFVPSVAGLNFEHIHDGTAEGLKEKFEPRVSPMQLRVIDAHTVEVYQPPSANWKLESCGRYHLLDDGVIEYTFECIPRAGGFRNGYIGLFWASYIHQPEQGSIFFKGRLRDGAEPPRWIEATSPSHGTDSTHGPALFPTLPPVGADFPLTLVNHPSKYVYAEPWYFGVSRGMAYVLMFRNRDRIWMAQSPSGGGPGNPAWDFQWFITDYRVGQAYGFVVRAAYLPYESREQVERETRKHREALNPPVDGRASSSAQASTQDLIEELKKVPYKIVFESHQDQSWDLFQIGADGSNRVNLTRTPDVNELYPHVSRDGTKVCFAVDEGEGAKKTRNVYCMNLDGTGRRLIARSARDACWAAGDRAIVYLKNEFEKLTVIDYATKGVFVHDMASGREQAHPNPELEHMYCIGATPDGKWYLATAHGGMGFAHAILAIEAQGKRVVDLKIPGCRPDISPDGRRVAWASGDYSLAVGDLDFSGPEPRVLNAHDILTSPPPWKIQHIDWSPDGKYVAFSRGPYKKGLAEPPSLVGVLAPGWNICVADPGATNRWAAITSDGNSNKEPDWAPIAEERR